VIRLHKHIVAIFVISELLWAGSALAAPVKEATALIKAERYAEAVALLEPYVQEHPDELGVRYWLARALVGAGDAQGATTQLEFILERKPDSHDSRYLLALAYRDLGWLNKAREELELLLERAPRHKAGAELLAELETPGVPPTADTGLTDIKRAVIGGRVAIDTGGLSVDPGTVDVYSHHVYDYTFSSAPTDWVPTTGVWESTNRWTCQPEWSWYGGYSKDGPAAIWSKREFEGDIDVEVYACFKMGLGGNHGYKHPNDINVTICGDGANFASGYTFMLGAENNTYSAIRKGNQILARTQADEAVLPIFEDGFPSTYEWHRKWWGVRVRKIGGHLEFYLDNQLILEANDPAPLDGGRIALWTFDNGILCSRLKIYFARERTARSPMAGQAGAISPVTEVAPAAIKLTSATHPSKRFDFENDLGTCRNRGGEVGATLTIAEGGPSGQGHCLKLINAKTGGTFAATLVPEKFDLTRYPRLSFDYRAGPDVKVNFYLKAGGVTYEIVFAGRDDPAPLCQLLGKIQNVQADGQWHHAEFDLLGHLQLITPGQEKYLAEDLYIGNMNPADYLQCGFGGNQADSTYCLDNITLDNAGGSTVKLAAEVASGVHLAELSYVVDRDPLTVPPPQTQGGLPQQLELDGTGEWYIHVRPKTEANGWQAPVHFRACVDTEPPQVASVSPQPGDELGDAPIVVALVDPGGSGLDLSSLQVTVEDKALGLDDLALSYDPDTQTLLVSPAKAGIVVHARSSVAVRLAALRDRAGNQMPQETRWVWYADPAHDTIAPPAPYVVAGKAPLCDETFENDWGQFGSYGGEDSAALSLVAAGPERPGRCLKVYNPTQNGRFGIHIRREAFDAGVHRLVRFDYRCNERLRADFAVFVNGDWKAIKFADVENSLGYMGKVAGVQSDGQWHHTEFDLYEMLRKDDPSAPNYVVTQFVLADWPPCTNHEGQTYYLDNFQILPVNSGIEPLKIAWKVADISGVDGVRWELDTRPDTTPSQPMMAPEPIIDLKAPGSLDGWLHLSARDGAGNWSPPAHKRLLIDAESPQASPLGPPADSAAATSRVMLALSDVGSGIDPRSIVLSVDGVDYRANNPGLVYDSSTNKLTWNCEWVSPKPVVFADGHEVAVELKAAADFSGNAVRELARWSWRMDYSRDTTGPTIATVESSTHPSFVTNTFDDGSLGMWANRNGGAGAQVELDYTTAASGTTSVKLTQQRKGGHMQAFVCTKPYAADKYPVIAFDYRIPSQTKLDLMVQISGEWHAVAFTDAPSGSIGRFAGIAADDKWHHASIDLVPLLRKQQRRGSLVVQQIIFSDRNRMDNPAGAVAHFDNFIIGRVGSRAPALSWSATDTTGIVGYSYSWDQYGDTEPDEVAETNEQKTALPALGKGIWYFHIRAQDGAGNWGPTAHYGLLNAGVR